MTFLEDYKGGSWVLSDILRSDDPLNFDDDSHNVLTSANEKHTDACMGNSKGKLDWRGDGWSVKCEERYELETTTFGGFETTDTYTTSTSTTSAECGSL